MKYTFKPLRVNYRSINNTKQICTQCKNYNILNIIYTEIIFFFSFRNSVAPGTSIKELSQDNDIDRKSDL